MDDSGRASVGLRDTGAIRQASFLGRDVKLLDALYTRKIPRSLCLIKFPSAIASSA